MQDVVAVGVGVAVALAFQMLCSTLAMRGILSVADARKLMHIGMGPLYVATWLLYSDAPYARWACALIPLSFTAKFAAIGLGLIADPEAVATMSRSGEASELLRGPTLYGVVFVAATLTAWRETPEGVVAVMLLCGGDGFADVVGRRLGAWSGPLPWSQCKSWAGSAAMLIAGWAFAWAAAAAFAGAGLMAPGAANPLPIFCISLVATAVESLPVSDLDNVTVAVTAAAAGHALRLAGLWHC